MRIIRFNNFSVFTAVISQNSKNRDHAGVVCEVDRRVNVAATVGENNAAGDSRLDFGLSPKCTLEKYCRECAGPMSVKGIDAMAVDRRNLVMYDQERFERDTAMGEWKRRWAFHADGVPEFLSTCVSQICFWSDVSRSCRTTAVCETLLTRVRRWSQEIPR